LKFIFTFPTSNTCAEVKRIPLEIGEIQYLGMTSTASFISLKAAQPTSKSRKQPRETPTKPVIASTSTSTTESELSIVLITVQPFMMIVFVIDIVRAVDFTRIICRSSEVPPQLRSPVYARLDTFVRFLHLFYILLSLYSFMCLASIS